MDKVYAHIPWQNQPSTATALGATNLLKIDNAIYAIDDRVISMNTSKADQTVVNNLIQSITFNPANGVLTITKVNGTSTTIDTKLEKLAVNFNYDPVMQRLIITLDDGTVQHVDMSSLVTQYEFQDTTTVSFSVQLDGKIKANIINGSITADKLQPNYLADIIVQANTATAQANLAKRYAVGGVESGDTTDNAKYYKEQSEAAKVAAEAARNEAEDIVYGDLSAKNVKYNNVMSGLSSLNAQDAIDEINGKATQAFQSASDGKGKIKTAITGADPKVIVPTDATFAQLATAIGQIKTGIDTGDATATSEQILAGLTAYIKGVKVTGTMPNYAGATLPTTTASNTLALVDDPEFPGQHSVIKNPSPVAGCVDKNTVNAMRIGNLTAAVVKAGTKIGKTAADAAVGTYIIGTFTADATAGDPDVLAGKTYYRNGVKGTGTIPNKSATTYTPGTTDQTISAGQYLSGAQIVKGDANLKPSNILYPATIFGIAGTAIAGKRFASGTAYSTNSLIGYTLVNGQTSPSYPLTVSGLTFTARTIIAIFVSEAQPGWLYISLYDQISGTVTCVGVNNSTTATGGGRFKVEGNCYITASGFSIPANAYALYNWYAYE